MVAVVSLFSHILLENFAIATLIFLSPRSVLYQGTGCYRLLILSRCFHILLPRCSFRCWFVDHRQCPFCFRLMKLNYWQGYIKKLTNLWRPDCVRWQGEDLSWSLLWVVERPKRLSLYLVHIVTPSSDTPKSHGSKKCRRTSSWILLYSTLNGERLWRSATGLHCPLQVIIDRGNEI